MNVTFHDVELIKITDREDSFIESVGAIHWRNIVINHRDGKTEIVLFGDSEVLDTIGSSSRRTFIHADKFLDGTDRIEYIDGVGFRIDLMGNRIATTLTIEDAERNVKVGQWFEV